MKILLPAFYARKKMNLPLIASCCAIGTNVILNLILMGPLMQGGIALATTVSSVLNNVLLFCFLAEDDLLPDLKQLVFAALRALLLSVAVMLLLWSVYDFAAEKISVDRWVDAGATLLLFVLAGVLYIVLSFLFRVPEAREFFAVAMRKKK